MKEVPTMARPPEIYDYLMSTGAPTPFTGVWRDLKPSTAFRDLVLPAKETRKELRKRFEVADLLAAGVFVGTDKKPRLNPLLRKEPRTLLSVLQGGRGMPYDIVGNDVAAMSGDWAVKALLHDVRLTSSITRMNRSMLAVADIRDVAILQGIGVFTVPATAFHRLGPRGISAMRQELMIDVRTPMRRAPKLLRDDVEPSGDGRHIGMIGEPPRGMVTAVTFADWSVSQLDPADIPMVHEIAKDLARMEEALAFDLESFALWKPSAQEIADIDYAIQRGSKVKYVARALSESLRKSSTPLVPSRRRGTVEELHREGVRNFLKSLGQAVPDDRPRREWDEFRARVDRELAEPIRGMANETSDPIKRQRLAMLAELSPATMEKLHGLRCQGATSVDGGPAREAGDDEWKATMAMVDRMIKLMETVA
jgi:hypothetical protein